MTSYPDVNRVEKAMKALDFLLVMDIFPTPTTKFAHLVLPATSFGESDGTFSSSERRVQRVRPAIDPIPGKTNWETIQELSSRMGYPMNFTSGEDIFNEMASLTPAFGGMTFRASMKRDFAGPAQPWTTPAPNICTKTDSPGGWEPFNPSTTGRRPRPRTPTTRSG